VFWDVTKLDEYLGPLDHGIWEVVIPKESVTEPLDDEWVKSPINVPSPGTIASYRKGRYHVHEQATEWRVHLDNHDPKTHPYLHLVDDAPLLLMIGDTLGTLIAGTRKKTGDEKKILEGQNRAWQEQVIIGILLMLVGVYIISNPLRFFQGVILYLVPLAIVCLGIVTLVKGIQFRPFIIRPGGIAVRGIAIIFAGIIAFLLPLNLWIVVILGVLGLWMFASAVVLLWRARRGRAAIPEGFFSRVIIACVSLILVALIFVNPTGILQLLMIIVGVVALLLGLMLLVNGIRLMKRMRVAKKNALL
jgi:uncharacterized membrane protein HdeD (DUF308 family)